MKNFYAKLLLLSILLMSSTTLLATNYYVDAVNGSNSNNGLTPGTAFQTLAKVSYTTTMLNPGDVVYIRAGTYGTTDLANITSSFAVLAITQSGVNGNPITFKAYPGESPLIQFNNWHGIYLQAAYVVIEGIRIRGNSTVTDLTAALNQPSGCNDPTGTVQARYNGNGITLDPNGATLCHHVTVRNCEIYECCGAGVGGVKNDYITIENNKVYSNCFYTRYGTSGISLLHLTDYDANTTTYRNVIRNNIVYDNELKVPWYSGSCRGYTDGNGIIIDDSRNGQSGGTNVIYYGKTLIENNVVYNNGGRGIHIFVSDNVTVINNTVYQNNKTNAISEGEITITSTSNSPAGGNRVYNNVLYARSGKKISTLINQTGFSEDYNIMYNSPAFGYFNTHDIAADPMFTDTANKVFTLLSGSQAINAGTNAAGLYSATDIVGVSRPQGLLPDMGAYELPNPPSTGAVFTAGNIVGLRVGDGTPTLGVNASAVNLLEYTPAGAFSGVNITLGDASGTSPNRMVTTGNTTGTYEGQLNVSADGRYLTAIGYDAAVSSAPAMHQAADKVIARVAYDGTVDYSTRFAAASSTTWFNGASVRGVVTDNGSRFWVNGSTGGTGNANGARYLTYGSTTSSNPISGSIRAFNIFKNRLYYLPNFTSMGNYTVDFPTNAPTSVPFPGSPGSGNSGAGFVLYDMDPTASYNGTGYDVLYLADASNGLYKYTWNTGSSTWVAAGSFNPASATGITGGLLGLAGTKDANGNPVLYGVKGVAANNNIIALTDTSGYAGNLSATAPTAANIASAGANYMFRGVALSPTPLVLLPVKVFSFEGYLIGGDASLQWTMATAEITEKFVVEKSDDGRNYNAAGTVSAGSNAGSTDYRFTDKAVGKGVHYYRLKVIGRDGQWGLSKVVVLRQTGSVAGGMKLFPNPVANTLFVTYAAAGPGSKLVVADVTGRVMIERTLPALSTQASLDVSNLIAGEYILSVYGNEGKQASRFIK